MSNQQIDYAGLVEKALLRVVHDVLADVASKGLPGRHHFYITFRTDHPGVDIDGALRARYPNEMTIVLENKFWGLEVGDDGFRVMLAFGGTPQRLGIPFEAVTVFADPSVEFGLQFTRLGAAGADAKLPATTEQDAGISPEPLAQPASETEAVAAPDPATDRAVTDDDEDGADKVVTLDRFRKK